MLNPNQTLRGRYQIHRQLSAQGNMSVVYQATDLNLQKSCVVKELAVSHMVPPNQMAGAIDQFQQEARTLSSLNHPGLPRVTDYFAESNSYFLVMDYIAGDNLYSLIGPGLSEAAVKGYAAQLLDILAYLHSLNIVHRDVKPANLIVQPDGRVALVDFGLVKPGNLRTAMFARGMGTPAYAPPEQMSGGTDPRSDLYAVGATLYHALTGQAPPSAEERGLGQPLIAPRQLRPNLSPSADTAVLKALALDRNARFQSAIEFKMALCPPAPTMPLSPGATKRTRSLVLAAAAVMVALLLVCGGAAVLVLAGIIPWPPIPGAQAPNPPPAGAPASDTPVPDASGGFPTTPAPPPPTTPASPPTTPAPPPPTTPPPPPPTTPAPPPAIAQSSTLGTSAGGRPIHMTTIGYPDGNGPAIVVVGKIEGEQVDTPGAVDGLIQSYSSRPASVPNESVLLLIRDINPDGSSSQRLNDNHVDLNRNWDTFDWTRDPPVVGNVTAGAGGSQPFSEPETQALRNLFRQLLNQGRPVRLILLHSSARAGHREVFPGYTSAGAETQSGRLAQAAAAALGFKYKTQSSDPTTGEAIGWCAANGIPAIDLFWSRNDGSRPSPAQMASVVEVVAR